jgi:hypothetical protein
MGYDPEPPTRRIPPQAPEREVVRTTEPVVDDVAWRQELLDRIGALRTGLVLVGLLAAAALGLTIYHMLTDEDQSGNDGTRGASSTRVTQLENRVDDLESEVDDRATKSSVSELRADQEELAQQVEEAGQAADGGADAADVEALQQDVQTLEQRIEELEQSQQEEAATPP